MHEIYFKFWHLQEEWNTNNINWGQDKHKTHTLHAEDQIKTQNRKYYEIFSNRLKNKLKKTKIYICPIKLHSTYILKNVNLIFHNMNGDIL